MANYWSLFVSFFVGLIVAATAVTFLTEIRKKAARLWRRVFFISSFISVCGILIVLRPPGASTEGVEVWRDIGKALIAAGIIGCIIELSEIKSFFTQLITETVTELGFRKELSEAALLKHSVACVIESTGRLITNREHECHTFVLPVLEAFISHLKGVYRQNYDEAIEFSVLSRSEAESKLSEMHGEQISLADCPTHTYLLETRTTFFLVSPRVPMPNYAWPISIDLSPVPGLSPEKHAVCYLKIGDEPEQRIKLKQKTKSIYEANDRNPELELVPEQNIQIHFDRPKIRLEMRTRELNSLKRTTFTVEMVILTKGLNVVFSANQDVFPYASIFGLNTGEYSPEGGTRLGSITRSDLILLPGHGYVISWTIPPETAKVSK